VELHTTKRIDASHPISSIKASTLPQVYDYIGIDGYRCLHNLVDVFPYELELGFHSKEI
jgi:hypothetical protein